MSSFFNLFRILTAIVLTIAIFLSCFAVFSLFKMPSATSLLVIMIFAAPVVHSILSQALQRHMMDPNLPMKHSTPGGIRVMGYICMAIAILFLLSGTVVLANLNMIEDMALRQNPDYFKDSGVTKEQLILLFKAMCIFYIVYSTLIIANVILSLRFVSKWKDSQGDDMEILDDDSYQ